MRVRTAKEIWADIMASGIPDATPWNRPKGHGLHSLRSDGLVDTSAVAHAFGVSRRTVLEYVATGRLTPHVRGRGQHPHLFLVEHVQEALGERPGTSPQVSAHPPVGVTGA